MRIKLSVSRCKNNEPASLPSQTHDKNERGSNGIINGVIDEIVLWIDSHLQSNLRADAIAYRAGYSKWHLQRKFRERTGISFTGYVREKRLERATELLVSTSMSLKCVAEACGINIQQLGRLCKALLGTTPKAIRDTRKRVNQLIIQCPPGSSGNAFRPGHMQRNLPTHTHSGRRPVYPQAKKWLAHSCG